MTNETPNQDNRIIYLYRITNLVNEKVYIGQTVDPTSRWRGHRRDAADPKVPFHHAIKKYGADNFEFEIIACCNNQEDANETETQLVKQYDCYISDGKGYNATHGGFNAPKSEEWKQALRDWHASMSSEEKEKRSKDLSEKMISAYERKGNWNLGSKRTDEQRARMSAIQLSKDNESIYTPEVRQNMSEAHIGIKDTKETKQKKSESAMEAWEKRIDYSRRCEAPGCEVSGKAKYKIIDGIRYCNKHGLRILRYDRLNTLFD